MIRVNLLPIKQARRRSAGRTQLLVFAGLLIFEVIAIGAVWATAKTDLDNAQERVTEFKKQVKEAKKEVADAKQLKEQKKQLEEQLRVLDRLEAQRSGPVRVLDEFQSIMSPPRNEEDRFAQLQKNWNVDWDPRRLWVESLQENEGSFTLQGHAVNADDVAEFLQRLTTAKHFYDVQLQFVEATKASGSTGDAPVVQFVINGKISYAGNAGSQSEEGS